MFERFLYTSGLILLFIALAVSTSHSQPSAAIFGNFGYATFSGGDAKEYNASLLESAQPVPAKLLSNYPGYYLYSGKVSFFIGDRDMMISAYAGHTSTGSRISYADYSGFLYIDQRVVTTSLGAELAVPFFQENNFEIFGGIRYMANFNELELDSKVQTPKNYDHVTLLFNNVTHGFQPTVYLMKSIRSLIANLEVGYEYQIPQKLFLTNNGDTFLVDDDGEAVRYSGSGIRIQIGIGLRLARLEHRSHD